MARYQKLSEVGGCAVPGPVIWMARERVGTGQGAILDQDQTVNLAANPRLGLDHLLFETGEGLVSPAIDDSTISTALSGAHVNMTATFGRILAIWRHAGQRTNSKWCGNGQLAHRGRGWRVRDSQQGDGRGEVKSAPAKSA